MNNFLSASNYWIHDLSPFLWEFPGEFANWGPGGIRWYGISYLLGFISAYLLLALYFRQNKSPYDQEQIINLITFQVIGVLIGGRIGYLLLYQGDKFLEDPLSLVRVWEGGMASHGGFIGVFIATLWYAKKSGQSVKPIGDLIVSVVPPGLFFGRIANFINAELYGRATNVSWGMIFPSDPEGIVRHPSQLYEAALEGIALFIFLNLISKDQKSYGRHSAYFLIGYGLTRSLAEFFRVPDYVYGNDFLLFSFLTQGQLLCIPMIILGVLILIKNNARISRPT